MLFLTITLTLSITLFVFTLKSDDESVRYLAH